MITNPQHAALPAPLRFGFPADRLWQVAADQLPLADRVAAKLLARQARVAGARPFVQFGAESMTYCEADRRANRVANAFATAGIGKGQRVVIALRNRLEFLDLWFGLSRLGAIQVPVNTEYKVAQILHMLRRAPVAAVVVEPALAGEVMAAVQQIASRPCIIVLGDSETGLIAGALHYESMVANADQTEPAGAAEVSGADVGAVMNTSGTTGPSKGVRLSHAQQYILGRMIAADTGLGPDDVYYNFFPMFHNTAQAMITLPVLLCGARMVLTERFSASRFWPEAIEHGCTVFYYIGEIMRILLKSTTLEDARGSRLRVGWGIGASPKDFAEFRQRFGIALRTGYGSTEANVPCYLPHDSAKVGIPGRVVDGFELRIANEQGVAVPAGVQGEILVRSSEPCALMLGYDGDPVATEAAWQDQWFHSGDAGVLDADGDLTFMGRVRDVIRVRGESVSAFEVEEVISAVDGVQEVAAIAVPSELGGDDLKVVVVVREGAGVTAEHLIAHAEAQLPRFCVPRYVEFVAALPKTPTNKVQKHVLRAQPFGPETWDRRGAR